MNNTIKGEDFVNNLLALIEETFEKPRGIYLDKDAALFQTLETISAEEASVPVGGKCASLAAQVTHVNFYLEVLERYIVNHDTTPADWGEVWRTVEQVTPQEWAALKSKLQITYQRVSQLLREHSTWDDHAIGGSLGIVVHTAYHLGEIRQALCVLQK